MKGSVPPVPSRGAPVPGTAGGDKSRGCVTEVGGCRWAPLAVRGGWGGPRAPSEGAALGFLHLLSPGSPLFNSSALFYCHLFSSHFLHREPKAFQRLSLGALCTCPSPARGGRAVVVRAFPASRSPIPRPQRTCGVSPGRAGSSPRTPQRLGSQQSPGPPRQPSLFCHIGLFFLLLNRLNDRGLFFSKSN